MYDLEKPGNGGLTGCLSAISPIFKSLKYLVPYRLEIISYNNYYMITLHKIASYLYYVVDVYI